jgi:hypothetical protein
LIIVYKMVLGNNSNFSQRRVTFADCLDVTPCSYFDKLTEFKLTVEPHNSPSCKVKRFVNVHTTSTSSNGILSRTSPTKSH